MGIEFTISKYKAQLMQLPNVKGIGIGKKVRGLCD
jgi:hypothetical protein